MVRFFPALGLAAFVTAFLIFLMNYLIIVDMRGPGEVKQYKVPDIVMPEVEIKTEYDTSKPDRPPEVEEIPPDLPDIEFEAPEMSQDAINIRPGSGIKPSISGPGVGNDGEPIAIVRVQPDYPRQAAQRGKEGVCVVTYTITTLGTTKDIAEHDCPDKIFLRASKRAAAKWKYKPRVIEGEAVEVYGVLNSFTFELAKDENDR